MIGTPPAHRRPVAIGKGAAHRTAAKGGPHVTVTDTARSVRVLNDGATVTLPRALPRPAELAGPAWWAWEATYIRALVVIDLAMGTIGALAALQFRMGPPPSSRFYLF